MNHKFLLGLVVSISALAFVGATFQSPTGVEASSPNAKKNRSSVRSSIASSRPSSVSSISSSRSSSVSSVANSPSSVPSSTSSSIASTIFSEASSSVVILSSSASSVFSVASSIASSSNSSAGRMWGAFVGNQLTDAATFEAMVGKTMNMQSIFVGGSDPFPSQYGPSVRDQGKTLVIFWEPSDVSLDAIIGGSFDAMIQQFRLGAIAYAGPVIFVPFPEMNGNWESWNGTVGNNTPAKFIAAWKRVHGLLNGASNVKFAWDVNHVSVPDTAANAITNYYPGDAYVDYVGIDGFNWGDPWQTFNQVFGSALTTVSVYQKPVMLLSMASAAGPLKAAWITDALTTQMVLHPEIKGWIWFNISKERDWRVNSDPAALNAFQSVLP